MTLVQFIVTLVILGIVWYLALRYLPLPDIVKTVLNIVGVLVVIFLVLALFGVMPIPFDVK
jgi:hypothetical protein